MFTAKGGYLYYTDDFYGGQSALAHILKFPNMGLTRT